MEISQKVAYLKGLAEGLALDTETKEGKLIAAIIDVLDEMSIRFEDIDDNLVDLEDGLDAVSDDLSEVEEALYEMDEDDEELEAYLKKLLHGEAFDRKGLIYGMGHAVYSLSDPREVVFKGYVEQLAHEKGRDKDLSLYTRIERMAPQLIAQERKIFKGVSPNVDFYSGFVYDMLGIPQELYTAMFAVARIVGWSAHRIEELICMDKIIRPAYMSVMEERE